MSQLFYRIFCGIAGLVLVLAVALPAEAAVCRSLNQHTVCILTIQRSAKHYWEYRATITVDGVERPIATYNCRDRVWVQKDGTVSPFQPDDPGEVICRFFKQ